MTEVRLRPAEAVLAGHPDKLADAVADALVGEATSRNRMSLVGVEVAVHRESVFLTGRIAGPDDLTEDDVADVVREVYAATGYGEEWGPTPAALRIVTDLALGPLQDGEAEIRSISADQAISIGYAVDRPATDHLPPEHWLARRIARELAALRSGVPGLHLGPDGKVALLCAEPADGGPIRIDAITVSLQQRTDASVVATRRAVLAAIRSAMRAAPEAFHAPRDLADRLVFNGAGDFDRGGPHGDNGLSGKKLVVDAYGPRVPIGGGALSGKDFFKVDRAGAIAARRLALGAIRDGLGAEVTAELLWRPGDAEARIAALVDGDGRSITPGPSSEAVDLSLEYSGHVWPAELWVAEGGSGTLRARFSRLAAEGHFGTGRPWERDHEQADDGGSSGQPNWGWCGTGRF